MKKENNKNTIFWIIISVCFEEKECDKTYILWKFIIWRLQCYHLKSPLYRVIQNIWYCFNVLLILHIIWYWKNNNMSSKMWVSDLRRKKFIRYRLHITIFNILNNVFVLQLYNRYIHDLLNLKLVFILY